jgi:hypothetical protein
LYFKFITFILNALIIFFLLALTLPFAAQPTQNFSPNLYTNLFNDHAELFAITTSFIIAFQLTLLIIRKNVNIKRKVFISLIQSLLILILVLIYFLNMNYLSELMVRPTYE